MEKAILQSILNKFANVESLGGNLVVSANDKQVIISKRGELYAFKSGNNEVVLSSKYETLGILSTLRAISSVGLSKWSKTVSRVMKKLNTAPVRSAIFVPVLCSKSAVYFKDALSRIFKIQGSPVKILSRYVKLQVRSSEFSLLPEMELLDISPKELTDLKEDLENTIDSLDEFLDSVDFNDSDSIGDVEIEITIKDPAKEGDELVDIVVNSPFIEVGETPIYEFNAEGLVPDTFYDQVDDLLGAEIEEVFSKKYIPCKIALAYSSLAHSVIASLCGQTRKSEATSRIFKVISSSIISNGIIPNKVLSTVKITPFPKVVVSNVKGLLRFVVSEDMEDTDVIVETGELVEDDFEDSVEEIAIEDISIDKDAVVEVIEELIEVLELPKETLDELVDEIKDIDNTEEWVGIEDGESIEIEFEDDKDYEVISNKLIKSMISLGKDSKSYQSILSRLKSLKNIRGAYQSISYLSQEGKLYMSLQSYQTTGGSGEVFENVVVEDVNDKDIEKMEDTTITSDSKVNFIKSVMSAKLVCIKSKKVKSLLLPSSSSIFNSVVKDESVLLDFVKSGESFITSMFNQGKTGSTNLSSAKSSNLINIDSKNVKMLINNSIISDNGILSRALSNIKMNKVSRRVTSNKFLKSLIKSKAELDYAIQNAKLVDGTSLIDFDMKLIKSGKNVISMNYKDTKILASLEKTRESLNFNFISDVRHIKAIQKLGARFIGNSIINFKPDTLNSVNSSLDEGVGQYTEEFMNEPFGMKNIDDLRSLAFALSDVELDVDDSGLEVFIMLDDEALDEKDIILKLQDKEEDLLEDGIFHEIDENIYNVDDIVNEYGETLVDVANRRDFTKVVAYLKHNGVKPSKLYKCLSKSFIRTRTRATKVANAMIKARSNKPSVRNVLGKDISRLGVSKTVRSSLINKKSIRKNRLSTVNRVKVLQSLRKLK